MRAGVPMEYDSHDDARGNRRLFALCMPSKRHVDGRTLVTKSVPIRARISNCLQRTSCPRITMWHAHARGPPQTLEPQFTFLDHQGVEPHQQFRRARNPACGTVEKNLLSEISPKTASCSPLDSSPLLEPASCNEKIRSTSSFNQSKHIGKAIGQPSLVSVSR